MQIHNLQLGEDVHWCDKHDEDDDNSDEMVGIHKIFFDVEKKKLISLRKHE